VHLGLLFASEKDREAFVSSGVDVAGEALAVTMALEQGHRDAEYVELVAAGDYATQDEFRVELTVAR
jgi:hypothetical protein